MKWYPHLSFNGQCEAAFQFYERCLGGRIVTMLRWGESPMATQAPSGWSEKILHVTLEADGNLLSGADVPPAQYEPPKGFHVQLNIGNAMEAERIFPGAGGVRHGGDADSENVLVGSLWRARRPVRLPWEVNCESMD